MMFQIFAIVPLLLISADAAAQPTVIVVVGAEGTAEYGPQFAEWAGRWEAVCRKADANWRQIGLKPAEDKSDRDHLAELLTAESETANQPLWLVLIGHGTFDGKTARFNLRGPDLSADELAQWLAPLKRTVAVINCASSSGAFLKPLAMEGRIVVTATKSGFEHNYARFGDYLSRAIGDPESDFDKDGQTSLLEAYLSASRQVAEFYQSDARLATEHALLDDTGDGLGTPADWFRGVRAVRKAKDGVPPDGIRAHQLHLLVSDRERRMPAEVRLRRDELELAVFALRDRKGEVPEDEYYRRLEPLLVELAKLYEQSEPGPASP